VSTGNDPSQGNIRVTTANLSELPLELNKGDPFCRLLIFKDLTRSVAPPVSISTSDPDYERILSSGFGSIEEVTLTDNEDAQDSDKNPEASQRKKQKFAENQTMPAKISHEIIPESQDALEEEIAKVLASEEEEEEEKSCALPVRRTLFPKTPKKKKSAKKHNSPDKSDEDDIDSSPGTQRPERDAELFEINSNPQP
jgi:hypothetical protein